MADAVSIEHEPLLASVPPGTRAAVTGASGFIGGRLVERLLEQGAEVTSLVRRPGTSTRPNHKLVSLDIADADALKAALVSVQLVFHCAYDWADEPWNFAALNAMIDACLANGCERLVHISSFVAYETPSRGELTEETIGTVATSGYGYVKRSLDAELLQAVETRGLPATIVQPTIVYGPGCKPWTTDPADMLLHGTVVLPDKGEGVCNAVFVDDVVNGMILAAQSDAAIGRAFLISGDPVQWGEFYEGIADQLGVEGPVYLPVDAIRRANLRLPRLRRELFTPTMAGRWLARKRAIRMVMRGGMIVLPGGLRRRVEEQLFGPLDRVRGYVHIPDPGRLGFFTGRVRIPSKRARALLHYQPQFSLKAGMAATGEFLRNYKRRRTSAHR